MDHEFHSILTKLAMLEGRLSESEQHHTASHVKQEKPALFNFVKPVVEATEAVAEESSDDILSQVKNSLVDYLKNAEDSIQQDRDLLDKKKQDLDLKKKELKDLDLQQKKREKEKQREIDEVEDQEAELMNKTLERAAEHGQEVDHDLQIGDRVVVKGPNEYNGMQGDIVDVGRSGAFVIVDIDGDMASLHSSDVECVDEPEELDEISREKVDKYYGDVVKQQMEKTPLQPDMYSKLEPKRQRGIDRATQRLLVKDSKSELPFVESFMLDEVTECSINGDDDHGYEIRRGDRVLPTRFDDVEHARMAAQLFKNRRAGARDDDSDYTTEK